MQNVDRTAAAMMAVAVFQATKWAPGTEPETEMRRLYKRFVAFTRRVEQSAEAKVAGLPEQDDT